MCAHASILSVLASSIDRLIALVYSLRYWQIVTKKRISVIMCCMWIGIIAFDIIPLFPFRRLGKQTCHYVPTKPWSVTMHVVMNIIPLPILVATYIATIRIAFKHAQRIQLDKNLQSSKLGRKEKITMLYNMRATRKVLLIIASYFICVGPACIYYLLEWLCGKCQTARYKQHYEQYVHFVLKVLVNFNAVVSAVIFFWNSKIFRKNAKEIFSVRDRFNDQREFNSVAENGRYGVTDKVKMLNGNHTDGNDNEEKTLPSEQSSSRNRFKKENTEEGREELLLKPMTS